MHEVYDVIVMERRIFFFILLHFANITKTTILGGIAVRAFSAHRPITHFSPSKSGNRILRATTTCTTRALAQSKIMTSSSSLDSSKHSEDDDTDCGYHFVDSTPLIDVDCNLWHTDLLTLHLKTITITAATNKNTQQDIEPTIEIPQCFQMFQNDDMSDIVGIVSPSSTILEAQTGLEALKHYDDVDTIRIRTTVGIHPYHVEDPDLTMGTIEQHMERIQTMIATATTTTTDNNTSPIAAIGECGLDASEQFPNVQIQIPWFRAQIHLAQTLHLPLFVHERMAFSTTMDMLQNLTVPVIIHCFTGTVDEARQYVERGYSISLSGYIFREDAEPIRHSLEMGIIPLDRLMIETDAPYMGFAGCRDRFLQYQSKAIASMNSKNRKRWTSSFYPNPPSSLKAVAGKVIHHINVGRHKRQEPLLTETEFAAITTNNANRFFGFRLENLPWN